MTSFVRARPGLPLAITYTHAGVQHHITVQPAQGVLKNQAGEPALGVGLVLTTNSGVPWIEAVKESFPLAWDELSQTTQGLWNIIKSTLRGAPNLSDVVGPVGLVSIVNDAAQNGAGYVLYLAGFIAINLAVVNLIPIPALDGGRIFVLAVEGLTRHEAPRLAVQILNTIGIALIIILMITVTYHDIARLFV